MSTVISCVDELKAEGILSLEQERVKRGGKPHSVINVRGDKCVYGISYKSGTLTALAVDLKGEKVEEIVAETAESTPPAQQVISLAVALGKKSPSPLAVALALNCEERESILRALEERLRAKVLSTTNTAALAYRAFWQGSLLPVVAVGVGSGIKCACLEREGCRVVDLGDLASSAAFTGEGSYRALLSASRVERRLRLADFRGQYEITEEGAAETKEVGSYSRSLARALASLTEIAERMYSPQELLLFGEYITQGFFDRILSYSRVGKKVKREEGDRADFAFGAAVVALVEGVFS